ncbi:hypothetical protein BH24ACT26_BH24ACT26_02560 [soil metagenome]
MDAASGAAAVWWWLGVAALFLAVIPVVLILAQRLLQEVLEIRRYADDVLEHGVGITANLEPVPALVETRALVKRVGGGLGTYVGAVDRIMGG